MAFQESLADSIYKRMKIPNDIYMVGIGGIGMSALAQLLVHQGKNVSGSDREESPVTAMLTDVNIKIWIGHDQCHIPADTELLIYSDAVWSDNVERMRAKEIRIPEMSYFEALGDVSKSARTIAVSGTHGKTTTTGMLAKILQHTGKEPTSIIGSIVRDFGLNRPYRAVGRPYARHASVLGSNFLAGSADLLVVEACEYKNHLLKLSPEILVITNIELDHTDYFPNIEALQKTFRIAAHKVPHNGFIITDPAGPNIADVLVGASAHIVDYTKESVPKLSQIGEFNLENARAAKAAARAAFPDLNEKTIDEALSSFKGSWRRFEYKGETRNGALVYDDYAHHPTAIRKTIEAARKKFPDKKIVIAFHPHLYSRTRDLMDDFAKALSLADEVVLAPIYAARENPVPGVSSEALAEKVAAVGTSARAFASPHDVYLYFTTTNCKLLTNNYLIITMGAGDIYKVAEQLIEG